MLKIIIQKKYQKHQQQARAIQNNHNNNSSYNHDQLAPDIVFSVFFYMSRKELLTQVSLVCKEWYKIAHHKQLWWHHTLVLNPYYYDTKKYRFETNGGQCRVRSPMTPVSASSPWTSSAVSGNNANNNNNNGLSSMLLSLNKLSNSNNQSPISPSSPVTSVSPAAQLFHYKHYHYKNNMLKESVHTSISKMSRIPKPITVLNCKSYYMEQVFVSKISSSNGENDNKISSFSANSVALVSPVVSAISAGVDNFLRSGNNNNGNSNESFFTKIGRNLLKPLMPLSGADAQASYSTGGSGGNYTPTAHMPIIERSEELEKRLLENNPSLSKRYRHTLTVVERSDGARFLYMIGGVKSNAAQQQAEFAEDEVYVIDLNTLESRNQPNISNNNNININSNNNPAIDGSNNTPLPSSSLYYAVKVKGKPPHLGKHTACAYYGSNNNVKRRSKDYPLIYIFGGAENDQVTNHLYVFDLNTNEWHLIKSTNNNGQCPPPTTNHQACIIGHEMYVIGGGIGNKMVPSNHVWVLNCDTFEWKLLDKCTNHQLFTPRLGFVMISVNSKILIYGGGYWQQNSPVDRYWKEKYTDLFIFDTKTHAFTKIDTSGPHPLTGTFPAHALLGSNWFIIGGAYDQEVSNEIYMLDIVTFTWRRLNHKFYGGDSLCAAALSIKSKHDYFNTTRLESHHEQSDADTSTGEGDPMHLVEEDTDEHGTTTMKCDNDEGHQQHDDNTIMSDLGKKRATSRLGTRKHHHHLSKPLNNAIFIFGGYCYHPLGSLEILHLNYLDVINKIGFSQ